MVNRTVGNLLIATLLAAFIFACPSFAKQQQVVLNAQNEQQRQAIDLMIQGAQLLKAKKPFAARPILERANSLWPDSPHSLFNLGLCYSETGQFQKAIDAYQRAYRLDHKLTEVLPNIASCFQLMNQPMDAVPWFEEYLRREPHAHDAPQVQGMINALKHQSEIQIDANPQMTDYLPSICPQGKVQRWQRAKIPLRIFISNGADEMGHHVRGFRDYYNEILVDSFDSWIKAAAGHLAYIVVDNVQDANIVCTWTDKKDFLKEKGGNAVEQGAARISARPINDREDEIGHVRVIILISDVKGDGNISDDMLKMACLHEIGHALGLAGHSSNNRDIMFFSESPTVWPSLTKRDKATMSRLYSDYPLQFQPAAPPQQVMQMQPPQQSVVQQQWPPGQGY